MRGEVPAHGMRQEKGRVLLSSTFGSTEASVGWISTPIGRATASLSPLTQMLILSGDTHQVFPEMIFHLGTPWPVTLTHNTEHHSTNDTCGRVIRGQVGLRVCVLGKIPRSPLWAAWPTAWSFHPGSETHRPRRAASENDGEREEACLCWAWHGRPLPVLVLPTSPWAGLRP